MKKVLSILIPLSVLFPSLIKNSLSLPLLSILNQTLGQLPFSVLEWSSLILIPLSFLKPRILLHVILVFAASFMLLWLPLYESHPPVTATLPQMTRLTHSLIRHFNENPPDFSTLPDDLPAKFAAFPLWMRVLNISGIYSFLTGEILISPEIPYSLIPFVAVHESIHASGIADEGRCNILAYDVCMQKGGTYADSARLWALKYALAELRNTDSHAYSNAFAEMSEATLHLLRISGGVYERSPFSSDYEILARHLAAQLDG